MGGDFNDIASIDEIRGALFEITLLNLIYFMLLSLKIAYLILVFQAIPSSGVMTKRAFLVAGLALIVT